jgi:hypothetical protein
MMARSTLLTSGDEEANCAPQHLAFAVAPGACLDLSDGRKGRSFHLRRLLCGLHARADGRQATAPLLI